MLGLSQHELNEVGANGKSSLGWAVSDDGQGPHCCCIDDNRIPPPSIEAASSDTERLEGGPSQRPFGGERRQEEPVCVFGRFLYLLEMVARFRQIGPGFGRRGACAHRASTVSCSDGRLYALRRRLRRDPYLVRIVVVGVQAMNRWRLIAKVVELDVQIVAQALALLRVSVLTFFGTLFGVTELVIVCGVGALDGARLAILAIALSARNPFLFEALLPVSVNFLQSAARLFGVAAHLGKLAVLRRTSGQEEQEEREKGSLSVVQRKRHGDPNLCQNVGSITTFHECGFVALASRGE